MTEPSKDPRVGTLIREYEILEVLGQGGMGSVYRARHTLLEEIRAIKLIKASLQEDTQFVNRFIREAKILVKLRHPNLVHFYEFGALEENVFFMVIEFLHGESALQRVNRLQKIPFQDAIRIVREAALGLHRAHQKDVIHRDISPDNLLLVRKEDGSEITKVIDFGIAKPVGVETKIYTQNNAFLGKPEFCSPEQCGILQEGEVIDGRSDIYSLGVTLYFLLTGKLPFYSTTPAGYLLKHVQAAPKPISQLLPSGECPPQLEFLIGKALAKNRKERFSSMDEFAQALAELENSKIVIAPEIPVDPSRMPAGYVFMNRYKIVETVHEGRKGIVYRAKDEQQQKTVALKIINPVLMPSAKDRSRFVRGLRLAQRVTHPNVCRVYEVAESGKNIYVSMEFLEGNTLAEILGLEGRLRLPQALALFKQLLAGLSEAHRMGVIHRNLKPPNIMIGPMNEARLMDFATSISPDANEDALISSAGEFVGSPSYMAPEQFDAVQPDHTVDLYSFGVLMFQVLTGRLPFAGKTLPALVFAHSKIEPEKPTSIIPDFPVDLERILLKALQKKPQDRYQSAGELLSALQTMEESARKFRELFARGKQLYDANKLEEAVQTWREALAMFPQDPAVQRCIAAAENRIAGMR